jgi:predicted dehydrogenase
MKQTVLVVGAGHRPQATIFPALACLGDEVELLGVHTRTRRELSLFGGDLELTTRPLDDLDVARADTIVVAVPPAAVPDVLGRLTAFDTSRARLLLDTPVLRPHDLGAARLFSRFAQVLASEDCYPLPPFVLARRLLDEGSIGRLRHVHLFHSAYRHHALASLRQLTDHRPARIVVHRWNKSAAEIRLKFPGGVRATVVEPRFYEGGRLLVTGDKGSIADYPLAGKHAMQIGYDETSGGYAGLTLDGEPVAPSDRDLAFASKLPSPPVEDTRMQRLKIRGFMDVLRDAHTGGPARYDPFDSVLDSLALRIAERMPVVDVRLGRSRTLGQAALRGAARVLRRPG